LISLDLAVLRCADIPDYPDSICIRDAPRAPPGVAFQKGRTAANNGRIQAMQASWRQAATMRLSAFRGGKSAQLSNVSAL